MVGDTEARVMEIASLSVSQSPDVLISSRILGVSWHAFVTKPVNGIQLTRTLTRTWATSRCGGLV